MSRALNGYPDISEATRARVRRTADRMGYSPLAPAQAIRTGRVRTIGLVLQIGEPDAQRPFLAEFLAGVTTSASAEGWTLTVATAPTEDETCATLLRLVDERKVDGFIVPRTKTSDPRITALLGAEVPFVLYGRTGNSAGCAWFDILGETAMAQAVERLYGLGHRRIGFINGGSEYYYSKLRHRGFTDALAALGLEADPALVETDAFTLGAGEEAARHMLTRNTPPTAIVCATDMGALGVYGAARAFGLTIGQDLSVISYDGIPEGAHATPPLTTFEVDARAAGSRLATLLIRRIRGDAVEDLRETAQAKLLARGSDGPPAHSPDALRAKIARALEQV